MRELPKVRLPGSSEIDAIMAMCRRLHAENGLFSIDENKVKALIQRYYDRNLVILGVIGEPDRLEGSICLEVANYWYAEDNDIYVSEIWNYVEPEHRRSRNAEALLRFGMECAEKMGIPLLTGIITNKQMAGKVRLYRRILGIMAGAFFVHNSKWQPTPIEDHSDLRRRLKEYAEICNNRQEFSTEFGTYKRGVFDVASQKLAPLLREAAAGLASEDDVWGGPKKVA